MYVPDWVVARIENEALNRVAMAEKKGFCYEPGNTGGHIDESLNTVDGWGDGEDIRIGLLQRKMASTIQ